MNDLVRFNPIAQCRSGRDALRGLMYVVALTTSSLTQAQVIELRRQDIENRVEAAFQCYLRPDGPGCAPGFSESKPDCHLSWPEGAGPGDRVRISKKNSQTLNVDADLKCIIDNFPNPDVNVHLELRFSCFWREPSVKILVLKPDIDVGWPWYLDTLSAGVLWWIGNIASNTATSRFRASSAVQSFTSEQMVPIDYCPAIAVQSNGDVRIDLRAGNECTDGQTSHKACTGNYWGPGKDYLCVRGRWEASGGYCEPKPPPGGQRP